MAKLKFPRRDAVAAACGLLFGLTWFTEAARAEDSAVSIDNFAFTPASLTVKAGTKVTFTNRDDIPHTVVSTDKPPAFRSKAMDTDDVFSFVFDKPGSYKYFCSLHAHMQGTIIVL
jgi:plastocyanin